MLPLAMRPLFCLSGQNAAFFIADFTGDGMNARSGPRAANTIE